MHCPRIGGLASWHFPIGPEIDVLSFASRSARENRAFLGQIKEDFSRMDGQKSFFVTAQKLPEMRGMWNEWFSIGEKVPTVLREKKLWGKIEVEKRG